jgi:23S rRNA (uracil1939-C5)-methyltransferase
MGDFMQHLKIDDIVKLNIRKLGINGEGIGYDQNLAVFVDYALPFEEVEVKIKEVFDNRATATIEKLITESKDRIIPFCPVYEKCGGCSTQHYNYDKMLIEKRDILIQSLNRYVSKKIDSRLIKDIMPSPKTKYYRNKASLPVQFLNGKNTIGMYQTNSNIFVPIDSCPVQHEKINDVLKIIITLMNQYKMDAFDPKTKKGYVRGLVVRISENIGEIQVSFIMMRSSDRIKQVVKDLVEKEKQVVSVFEVYHPNMKKIGYFNDTTKLIYGKETIKEVINGQTFHLKPEAFFQLNTKQAENFYQTMKELSKLRRHEVAIDAYAGIAPVSHYIHDIANKVYAIEIDPSSAKSAELSLKENKIENVTVLQSDFKRALSGLKMKKIDCMFFDPPRTGLGKETIDVILEIKPKKLVYGSCNPSTLAKDLDMLLKDYELLEIIPIDMFPQTAHVESITLLSLK